MSYSQSAPSAAPDHEKKYPDPEKGPVDEIHLAIADKKYRTYPAFGPCFIPVLRVSVTTPPQTSTHMIWMVSRDACTSAMSKCNALSFPCTKAMLMHRYPDSFDFYILYSRIAIAGTIGTGLFLGSGHAIARAGPVGALLAYAFIASITYSTLVSLGEMIAFAPVSGSFPHFAARWVDPAYGFAVGWNYFYTQAISVPVEISAAQIILTFWDPNTNHFPVYLTFICLFVIAINLFGVRWFGESEFAFSCIKLMLIIGLIIAGLVIDLGGAPRHGE